MHIDRHTALTSSILLHCNHTLPILLSNDLGLEKRIAGKYELQTSTRLDSVTVNFNLKPKVLNRRKFPDVIRTDRQKNDYIRTPLIQAPWDRALPLTQKCPYVSGNSQSSTSLYIVSYSFFFFF